MAKCFYCVEEVLAKEFTGSLCPTCYARAKVDIKLSAVDAEFVVYSLLFIIDKLQSPIGKHPSLPDHYDEVLTICQRAIRKATYPGDIHVEA